ncbi:MAG TPA: hypothetical protein VES88_18440 [Gemmatimonadaceae bacterium]|nr:hypothetical protein [Gemmatimonadaceae bacterium]
MRVPLGSFLLFAAVAGALPAAAQPVAANRASIVRLVARDYSFETPLRLPSGIVRVRLVNRGSEPHYAAFYRLGGGRTATDFFTWRASRSPAPSWLTFTSGPAPVAPGDSTDLTVRLPPGHYMILCGYPGKDAVQHLDKGMFRIVDAHPVRRRSRSPAGYPTVARKITISESDISLDQPVPAGWREIGIENTGSTAEQGLIVRLPAGVKVADEQRWFDEGFRSPRRGVPWGGALLVAPGERYVITRYFEPGRYALISRLTGKWRSLLFVVAR